MNMDFYKEEMMGTAGDFGLNQGASYSFCDNDDVNMTSKSEGGEEEPSSTKELPNEYGNRNAGLESALYPT